MRGGECPVIPPVHWKGVALPQQRSSRILKTLSNCKGFYSVFSAVERFLYLGDFFYYVDRFSNNRKQYVRTDIAMFRIICSVFFPTKKRLSHSFKRSKQDLGVQCQTSMRAKVMFMSFI